MLASGTLSCGKLIIMDSDQSGRGLFAKSKFLKGELITFFGFPRDHTDSYGNKHKLPRLDDHIFSLNGVFYDNKGDADLFKCKNGTCYVPNDKFGYSAGLGWAANSSYGTEHKANCVIRKLRTYPLCQHILCTDMRFAEMEYLVLKATRDIFGGEEITHAYNLDGNLSRKRNNMPAKKATASAKKVAVKKTITKMSPVKKAAKKVTAKKATAKKTTAKKAAPKKKTAAK